MHIAEVEPRGELQFCEFVPPAQGKSTAEILDRGLNVAQLIMSLAAIDQDLASIGRLSISDQLSCSIQLLDGIGDEAFSEQQQAVLRPGDDRELP